MLRRKQTLTVSNRRSITEFFNRSQDYFARKFDGFPASVVGKPSNMPAINEGPVKGVDIGELIDEISRRILESEKDLCSDVSDAECEDGDCSGQSIVKALTHNDGEWEPPEAYPVDYYVEVWFDGILAVKDDDYVVCGTNICPVADLDTDVVVKARYVIL